MESTMTMTVTMASLKPKPMQPKSPYLPHSLNSRRIFKSLSLPKPSVGAPTLVDQFDPTIPIERAVTPPSSWYTDPSFYAQELDSVFYRGWQAADIGLAMGKQANWSPAGFRWGRSMHEKVLRVMQQQLTANSVAVTINCLAAVYYRHIPLNAVQFVWVNVIIFGLGPLVLATESPADDLMNVPPID